MMSRTLSQARFLSHLKLQQRSGWLLRFKRNACDGMSTQMRKSPNSIGGDLRVGGQGGNAFICEDFPFIGLVDVPFIGVCEDFPFFGSVDFPFMCVDFPFFGLAAGFFRKIPNKAEVAATIPGLCDGGF